MSQVNKKAPSATWRHPVWSSAQKSCVGTALRGSKLWFTTGRGIVTEVFYPRIDIPQIRDLGFIIADDQGFWQELKALPEPQLELDDPRVPLPIIRHHHERFDFIMRICADPERDVLLIDFELKGDNALRPYLLCSARLGEDAENNRAWVSDWEGRRVLWAEQGPFGLALVCRNADGYPALERCGVGEVGASDLWQDFHQNGRMCWEYQEAGPGEVALAGTVTAAGNAGLGPRHQQRSGRHQCLERSGGRFREIRVGVYQRLASLAQNASPAPQPGLEAAGCRQDALCTFH